MLPKRHRPFVSLLNRFRLQNTAKDTESLATLLKISVTQCDIPLWNRYLMFAIRALK